MLIYRFQDEGGNGPFKGWYYQAELDYLYHGNNFPTPIDEGLYYREGWKCATTSLAQLFQWFPLTRYLRQLQKRNQKLTVLDAEQVYVGKYQCVYLEKAAEIVKQIEFDNPDWLGPIPCPY